MGHPQIRRAYLKRLASNVVLSIGLLFAESLINALHPRLNAPFLDRRIF